MYLDNCYTKLNRIQHKKEKMEKPNNTDNNTDSLRRDLQSILTYTTAVAASNKDIAS